MARGYEVFQKLEKEEYIHKEDLKYMNDYICRNLNSDYCPTTSTGTTNTVLQQKHLLCADGEKREG